MNVDLLHALTARTVTSQSVKLVGLERALEMLPANIRVDVVDVAVAKSEATQRFVMTLLLRESGQKIIVESDLPAPKGATLTLTRGGGEIQWQPPTPVQQLQALIQLQRGQLVNQQTPLTETLQELQQWQQQLQSQPQLARPAKQQLALINQLLSNNLPNYYTKPAQAAQQIEQWVQHSGAFMEAKLAQGAVIDTKMSDQKFQLMRLFRLLQNTPPSPNNSPAASQSLPATKGSLFSLPVSLPELAPKATTLSGGKPIPAQNTNLFNATVVNHLLPAKNPPSQELTFRQFSVVNLPGPAALTLQTSASPKEAAMLKAQWVFQPIVTSKGPTDVANNLMALLPTTAPTPTSQSSQSSQSSPNSLLQLMLARPNNQAPTSPLPNTGPLPTVSQTAPMLATNQTFFLALPTIPILTINSANVVNTVLPAPPSQPVQVQSSTKSVTDVTSLAQREVGAALPNLVCSKALPSPNQQLPSPFVSALLGMANAPASKPESRASSPIAQQSLDIAGFWMPLNTLLKASSKKTENNVDRLLRHVFGGIARIHTLQLDTLAVTRDNAGNPAPASQWQMEIPLPMGDRWQSATLNIIKDEDDNATGQQPQRHSETRWGMRLCFDLAPYGQLTADASLCGHRLEARFWTDGADLKARVEQHLGELINRLREAGLFIEDIACQHGDAPSLRGKKSFDVEITS